MYNTKNRESRTYGLCWPLHRGSKYNTRQHVHTGPSFDHERPERLCCCNTRQVYEAVEGLRTNRGNSCADYEARKRAQWSTHTRGSHSHPKLDTNCVDDNGLDEEGACASVSLDFVGFARSLTETPPSERD